MKCNNTIFISVTECIRNIYVHDMKTKYIMTFDYDKILMNLCHEF